jgi:hypothetical protein
VTPPSPETPLTGACLCGGVRYEITRPFEVAGYCHCTHCQRRTGTGASANARVPREGFALRSGEELLRSFQPPAGGMPKVFCTACGSALFSGDLASDNPLGVRLGTLDADPGIRPSFRQFVSSAAAWEEIPDDGLTHHERSRAG